MCKIIYYHGLPGRFPELSSVNQAFTLAHFRRQIRWLSNRYELITVDEVLNRSGAKNGLTNTVCITTDDGLADNAIFAEIVAGYGGRMTLFLNTAVLDNRDLMWRHKVNYVASMTDAARQKTLIGNLTDPSRSVGSRSRSRLPQSGQPTLRQPTLQDWSQHWPMRQKDSLADALWNRAGLAPVGEFLAWQQPYLSWQQVRSLVADGHAVGTHTVSHPDCSRLDWDDLRDEVVESARTIREHTGRPVQALTWPFGRRPKPELERRLRHENPTIRLLMGIAPMFGFVSLEEREDMEHPFLTALFNLYAQPLRRLILS